MTFAAESIQFNLRVNDQAHLTLWSVSKKRSGVALCAAF
jgi:hypothetical protein